MDGAVISIATALASVLFALAMLHVAWAMGAKFGAGVVIPKSEGRPTFKPGRTATLLVAAALMGAMLVALQQGHVMPALLPEAPVRWAAFGAGGAFLLRAIGEFRLVGLFKRVRNTDFARWDSWCFSPLSAAMGSAFWFLAPH